VRIFWLFLFLAFWATIIFFHSSFEEEIRVINSGERVEEMESKIVGEKEVQIVNKTSGEHLEKFTIGWQKNFFREIKETKIQGRIVIIETGPFWILIGGTSFLCLLVSWGTAVLLAEARSYN